MWRAAPVLPPSCVLLLPLLPLRGGRGDDGLRERRVHGAIGAATSLPLPVCVAPALVMAAVVGVVGCGAATPAAAADAVSGLLEVRRVTASAADTVAGTSHMSPPIIAAPSVKGGRLEVKGDALWGVVVMVATPEPRLRLECNVLCTSVPLCGSGTICSESSALSSAAQLSGKRRSCPVRTAAAVSSPAPSYTLPPALVLREKTRRVEVGVVAPSASPPAVPAAPPPPLQLLAAPEMARERGVRFRPAALSMR